MEPQQPTAVSPQEEEALQEAALRQAFAEQQSQRYGESYAPEQDDESALQEAELSKAFAEQQSQRYGEGYQQNDEEALQEAALRQAFAEQQQARYGQQEPAPQAPAASPVDTRNAFSFSPMADLVDDGPSEPMFTLSPQLEERIEQQSEQEDDVPFGQFEPAAPVAQPQQPHSQSQQYQQPQQQQYQQPSQPQYQQPQQPVQQPPQQTQAEQHPAMDSLIHPFLMRNDQPLQKPTTPLPTLDLLTEAPKEVEPVDSFALEQKARLVEASLADYRVKADVVDILPGPVITRFELDLAPGVKAARISNLSRDLARSLSTSAVRVVEVIPGKPYVGLELPNAKRQTVYLREVLDCPAFRDNPSPLSIVLGKDISGEPVVADLGKMPHLLVAGTTGSGKSVGVNAMILSILYKATPKEVRFIMIDPKMLELSVYEGIPHLLTDVVTDMKDAANALRWCVGEMERRYKLMSALGVRNLAGYNERVDQAEAMGRPIPDPFWKPTDSMDITPPVLEKEPYIVVMVDEFADLIMTVGKKVEELIARLAQKARAAGIHLVLATQRPSVDVITGLIKANIPTRIAFTVSSKIDSRTILDQGGPSPCWVWVTCSIWRRTPRFRCAYMAHSCAIRKCTRWSRIGKRASGPNIKRVFSAAAKTARAVPAAVWTVTKSWIRCLTRRWISWWINAAPPSPACSASSVSVITARRASSNRWKRRASSASRGTTATARCWRRLGTIDGRLAIAIQSERAA